MPIDLTAFRSALPPHVGPFLARLASLGVPQEAAASPDVRALPPPEATLTPAMLRATLLQIGVTASAENLLLAEAFAQLGLPLTPASFTEAHVSLAQAPGVSPMAYALAKSLSLPTTPDILRALSTVTDGIPARRALPLEVTERLALAVPTDKDAETMAAHLLLMLTQRASSTEQRLTDAAQRQTAPVPDTRALLLGLAQSATDKQVRLGADTLAAHIEGQQLINLTAQRDQTHQQPIPLYFALPLLLPGEQTMLEMSVRRPDTPSEEDRDSEDAGWRTTIRLATSRLGRVEAELIGAPLGGLTCRLAAEQPATARLLERSREKLAASLASAGWPRCDVSCRTKADWTPLWHGGQALTAPRTRIDWEA